MRLDQALAQLLPAFSRSRLQQWIKAERVWIDGKTLSPKDKVWGGEAVVLEPEADPAEVAFAPENIPLDIIYQDDTLAVINKPAGLVVHPGSGNWSGTLLNALLHHFPQVAGVPRAGIVHRLDKDTSGLMVVAKTLTAQTDLVRQLQARTVKREYLALVEGTLIGSGRVDAPIGRHPTQRVKMAVVESGKAAVTHYQVVEQLPGCTLVRCRLETGRTHQIRVHMLSLGHPLVGDPVYGKSRGSAAEFARQALHATQLELTHPVSHEHMVWQAPLPLDMEQLLQTLREKR